MPEVCQLFRTEAQEAVQYSSLLSHSYSSQVAVSSQCVTLSGTCPPPCGLRCGERREDTWEMRAAGAGRRGAREEGGLLPQWLFEMDEVDAVEYVEEWEGGGDGPAGAGYGQAEEVYTDGEGDGDDESVGGDDQDLERGAARGWRSSINNNSGNSSCRRKRRRRKTRPKTIWEELELDLPCILRRIGFAISGGTLYARYMPALAAEGAGGAHELGTGAAATATARETMRRNQNGEGGGPDFFGPFFVLFLLGQFSVVLWIFISWLVGAFMLQTVLRVVSDRITIHHCMELLGYCAVPMLLAVSALILSGLDDALWLVRLGSALWCAICAHRYVTALLATAFLSAQASRARATPAQTVSPTKRGGVSPAVDAMSAGLQAGTLVGRRAIVFYPLLLTYFYCACLMRV